MLAFDDYLMLTGKNNKDNAYKRSLLLAVGGLDLRKVVNSLTLKDNKFETLIDISNKFLKPIKNVVLVRYRVLNERKITM